jgi:dTDP-4-dehydrorhamnose 3,5-epimerase-like enzyme
MGTKFSNTHIEGVCVIHGKRFHDCRGFFQELYNVTEFPAHIRFGELRQVLRIARYIILLTLSSQVSLSVSKRDALRGLHASPYDKLVSVVGGAVYDVVVDLRKHSPTCGKWIAHVLSLESKCDASEIVTANSPIVEIKNQFSYLLAAHMASLPLRARRCFTYKETRLSLLSSR